MNTNQKKYNMKHLKDSIILNILQTLKQTLKKFVKLGRKSKNYQVEISKDS